MITVVNYGAGNLRSVANTLEALGARYEVTQEAAMVESARAVILPGVGHFGQMMDALDRLGLREFVDLPGRVSNEFLFTALQTMDLGVACDPVNAYNDHCTMNKTLEYMAFGKPQVMFATTEGRASAAEAAVYVEENSPVKLAEAIASLLDDPAARQRMGRIGAERVRTQLNWERSVEQLLRAYECALGGPARGSSIPR